MGEGGVLRQHTAGPTLVCLLMNFKLVEKVFLSYTIRLFCFDILPLQLMTHKPCYD